MGSSDVFYSCRNVLLIAAFVLIVLIVSALILLSYHTGPMVCNERGSCFRAGPTHFELILKRSE